MKTSFPKSQKKLYKTIQKLSRYNACHTKKFIYTNVYIRNEKYVILLRNSYKSNTMEKYFDTKEIQKSYEIKIVFIQNQVISLI